MALKNKPSSRISGISLRTKLVIGSGLATAVGLMLSLSLLLWFAEPAVSQTIVKQFSLLLLIIFGLSICIAIAVSYLFTRHLATSLMALEVGLLNFKDNDFSVSLPVGGDKQLQALAVLFNESAEALRKERQYIYQRELLLDKVIQSSPNVMLLLDDEQRVIYANDAARHLFNQGLRIEGIELDELIEQVADELSAALANPKDGLFSLSAKESDSNGEGEPETWHLSRGQFLLNGQYHHLILLKQMTRELNRQEVAVWKKVIRIISHELNNSVAPIASMVNSGRMLTKDLDDPKLKLIFDTIEDRTSHLSQFIFDYARFAKLPVPKKSQVDWHKLTEQLQQHYRFFLENELPSSTVEFDLIQMEQVLLNLLKNAHESGAAADSISLSIVDTTLADGTEGIYIEVKDQGSGMPPEVLRQALLPFYSTKQSGTGLGLPLCREIIEAHDGRISLQNRDGKGLSVRLWVPK
ncbi:ATP-binding region, ATPase-like:Histidine kinase, HAMP region [Shewanella piezotolerans WP3]|uniref:histidine kinase n=1 Tax=Shewanella piezotolerans (strain WP3 / JCM 13877) TaxID=225849 RepID=B8CJ83_SHEPW|nr:ATP-binding protein [Shewanella piezotolerans]ACJ27845.1 ATP-binding region, ATPase-like:Histidine kinase, HAMP region [Shewanella piezotolerans WP3]